MIDWVIARSELKFHPIGSCKEIALQFVMQQKLIISINQPSLEFFVK